MIDIHTCGCAKPRKERKAADNQGLCIVYEMFNNYTILEGPRMLRQT